MPTREIKFRAWETISGQFLNKKELSENLWFLTQNPQVENIILEQFTGLKDEDGKEIYEGDIITCEITEREQSRVYGPEKYTVTYRDGYFLPFGIAAQWRSSVYNIKVIGNIHENPELLK